MAVPCPIGESDAQRLLAGTGHEQPRSALSPVGRETLHDRVYAELRRSLIHGMFDAGDMLRIQSISPQPCRPAPCRCARRWAGWSPNRRWRRCRTARCAFPLITRERLDDLARARCLIEGQMTALAVPNLTAEDFAALQGS